MFELTYWTMLGLITVGWIVFRFLVNRNLNQVSWKRELQLLMVYICIIVLVRIVYFPWHHVNGHIDTLKFDATKPLWINLVPLVHLFDIYDGWQMNIIGNITMFIPVGIVWPICFHELNTVGKTTLAGFGFTLLIEITQLAFYERCSDVDDMILNTTGVLIGALITFGVRKICQLCKR
ncbi:MAG: VanZ family protein [Lachnospiraceae bacterium]|nr:VanZ family protein [Lachnospiraceae bacterium]